MAAVATADAVLGAAGSFISSIANNTDEEKKTRLNAVKQMRALAYAGILTGMARAWEAGWPAGLGIAASVAASGAVQLKNLDKQKKEIENFKKPEVNPATSVQGGGTTFTTGFALGGYINGPRHENGGVPIEAEGGEFIIRRDAVNKFGVDALEQINKGIPVDLEDMGLSIPKFAYGGKVKDKKYEVGGLVNNLNKIEPTQTPASKPNMTINVNVSAPLLDDTETDEIIPRIQEAVRRGVEL